MSLRNSTIYHGEIESRYQVRNGDVLISWSGTPGTSFGAHIWTRGEAVLNKHIYRTEIDEEVVDRKFFALAVNYKLDEMILKAHGGVGLQHITKKKLESTMLPLPPLAEQRCIVAYPDSVRVKAEELKRQQQATQTEIDKLIPSVLSKAFRGEL